MTFKELSLIEPIQKALREEGYENPTPIQQQAIPHALQGKDLLACAQTGTGKTAAFAIPILQQLDSHTPSGRGPKPIRALILTPTRELAIQIADSFRAYGRHMQLNGVVIFGGVSQNPQVDKLKRGVDILVATPGRLLDLMNQGYISLKELEIFVLDEADRMLDMGFIHDVRKVIKVLPDQRQTLFFSATMPGEIAKLAHDILTDPVRVTVSPVSSTAEAIDQSIFFVDKRKKRHLLLHLLQTDDIDNALVFTRTKHGANRVARDLSRAGIHAMAIHGNKSQTARQKALQQFKTGDIRVLVATDIAARGIDLDELSHVINFDLPNVPETYVHRIGRTGRAGADGIAYSFCDTEEKAYLKDIQKLIDKKVTVVSDHPYPLGTDDQDERTGRDQNRGRNNRSSGRSHAPQAQNGSARNNRSRRRPSGNNAAGKRTAEKRQDNQPKRGMKEQVEQAETNDNPQQRDSEWSSIFQRPNSGKKGFVIKSDRYTDSKKKSSDKNRSNRRHGKK